VTQSAFIGSDDIRTAFSRAMSDMYRTEVPQYGTLMTLVSEVNDEVLQNDSELLADMQRADELDRLDVERHGAIRLGTAAELNAMRRLFAVMGMEPVGYYDLSVAGVPVHSTAFRPVGEKALRRNPFRVFTSLLRLELITDPALRQHAADILAARSIFTPAAMELVERFERNGGLTRAEMEVFVREALETFRWHSEASVSAATYKALHDAHRLIADVVSFKGPHINHLTPRTLDIDRVQDLMPTRGITPKETIEGPARRKCPILLRQTSFKALEEAIAFASDGAATAGRHTARFGEIEQRGVALTPKGRALYDRLLNEVRALTEGGSGPKPDYVETLNRVFAAFPDDYDTMRREGLAYFRYGLSEAGKTAGHAGPAGIEALVESGHLRFDPIIYEDFLPVSAAGIFQSNLQSNSKARYNAASSKDDFERDLGRPVIDEVALYAEMEAASIRDCLAQLGRAAA